MDLPGRHQANDFPAEAPPSPFTHSVPHQLHNHALQNVGSVFDVEKMPSCNDIPLPVEGVAGPGRVQDSHRIDMAYQGIIDYRHRLHAVSIFHLTATGSPYDQ